MSVEERNIHIKHSIGMSSFTRLTSRSLTYSKRFKMFFLAAKVKIPKIFYDIYSK